MIPSLTERHQESRPAEKTPRAEPKLLDQVRESLRVRHRSYRTEKAYVHWIRRFILFHGKRHPRDMGEAEINKFLTYLAVEKRVSPSTQSQALCALLFLYRTVLEREVGELEGLIRARKRRHLPVVLTRDEVRKILSHLSGSDHLFISLLYGTGMRLAIKTTMIYTHVLNRGGRGVLSPIDDL